MLIGEFCVYPNKLLNKFVDLNKFCTFAFHCKCFCIDIKMLPPINKIKGIPPGAILERELRLRKMKKTELAATINELPQMISYICKGTRTITPKLSLKFDRYFGMEDGYFMVLQTYYDIAKEKSNGQLALSKELPTISKAIFWDTDIEKLDWMRYKKAIIQRVFERGSATDIDEIIRFYGKEEVVTTIQTAHSLLYTAIDNAETYLGIDKTSISCFQNSTLKQPHQPYFTSSVK